MSLPINTRRKISSLAKKLAEYILSNNIFMLDIVLQDMIGSATDELKYATINSQSTSYELVLDDDDSVIDMNSGLALNVTVPLNSSVPFPIGTQVSIRQAGVGAVTIVPAGGVTLQSKGGLLTTSDQFAFATLIKIDTDTWAVTGALA